MFILCAMKIDRQVKQGDRLAFCLKLRKDGHSYAAIGEMLATQFGNQQGKATCSAMYAHKLVRQAIKAIYKDEANDLIRIEMERLDDMQLQALDVLRTTHLLVNSGNVVMVHVLDETGKPIIDPVTNLPKTTAILDDGPRLAAIDRLLKIQERRAKLLGLDKPTKVAQTNPEGTKAAVAPVIVASKEDIAL